MKVLIVKTSSLGDIIQAFPVLGYIRQRFPQAQIDWVVEQPFAELVQAHPYVNRTICIRTKQWRGSFLSRSHLQQMREFRQELRKEHYDIVFDLQSNIKSGLIVFQAKAQCKVGFGWKTAHEWPNALFTNRHYNPAAGINIRDDYLYVVQRHFDDLNAYEDPGTLLNISRNSKKPFQVFLMIPFSKIDRKLSFVPVRHGVTSR